jgi:nicotinate-nucleotide adenylyltransferase
VNSIGIYPGTFDPVHEGHISFAKSTLTACNLDIIYFVPEKAPRNKTNVTELNERGTSIQSALTGLPRLASVNLESNRFTVSETLPEIETRFGPATFTLLVGSDIAKGLENWPNCKTLLTNWKIAIGMRSGDNAEHIEEMFERIENQYELSIQRTFIHTDKPDFSSTQFREQT